MLSLRIPSELNFIVDYRYEACLVTIYNFTLERVVVLVIYVLSVGNILYIQ